MSEKSVRREQLMPLIRERLEQGHNVSFFPRGISMLPMLRQGRDCVILSPVPEKLKKYDLPLYQREDGSYVLHRIVRVGETYTCVGDNQFQLEYGLEHRQMIALVTAFERDGRRIEVSDPVYRLYCRFWVMSRPVRRIWRGGLWRLKRIIGRYVSWRKTRP